MPSDSPIPPADAVKYLLSGEGGCVSIPEAARRFSPSTTAGDLLRRIRNGDVIAYCQPSGEYAVPVWQFAPTGGLIAGVSEVLAHLKLHRSECGSLFLFTFFLQAEVMTGGRTPLETLRSGEIQPVLDALDWYFH
jgi:hypothetical protein